MATPNLNLEQPIYQSARWDIPTNANWDIIDTAVNGKLDSADLNQGIDDRLASGLVPAIVADDIKTLGQMTYASASDPAYENMFLRIGPGGTTELYKAPDQDEHWEDTDTTDVAVTTTPNSLLSVTPVPASGDITPADGSYSVSGKVSNNNNNSRTLILEAFDDGVSIGSQNVLVAGNESGKIFTFSSSIEVTITSGSVITVEFSASDTGNLTLLGTQLQTKFEITKAATPTTMVALQALDNNVHRVFIYAGSTGPILSLAEINAAVTEPIETMGKFFIVSNDHVYQVMWTGTKYYSIELTEAT